MALVRIIPILPFDYRLHSEIFSGGKVELGETPLEGAGRELEVTSITSTRFTESWLTDDSDQEEAGIRAPLEHAGSLLFISEGAERAFQIEIYRANSYEGTVTE